MTAYTAKIVRHPINGRFDVMVAEVGGTDFWKHGSYATISRAQRAVESVTSGTRRLWPPSPSTGDEHD